VAAVTNQRLASRAIRTGIGAAAVLAAVYVLAVWTPAGQRFEDGVLRATRDMPDYLLAQRLLDHMTMYTLAAVLIGVAGIGLVRRRLDLALVSAGVVVASLVASEGVQHAVVRPVLLAHGVRREDQSFPSGHAAIAMAVMCALVLVVPYRRRGWTVLVIGTAATVLSVETVTADWHRPSDTLGSAMIVLIVVCAALLVLAGRGTVTAVEPAPGAARLGRGLVAGVFAATAAVSFVVLAVTLTAVLLDRAETGSGVALAAGRATAVLGSTTVTLILLALLRHLDLSRPEPVRDSDRVPSMGRRGVDVAS
jgi:hypothetical protein